MQRAKGMVQVDGTTYRISWARLHVYEVVRILDNQVVGWFSSDLSTILAANAGDLATLRNVARQAVQKGKTSWTPRDEEFIEPHP